MVDSPEHLDGAYRSLLTQADPNWEWLVVPLGRIELEPVGDARVRALTPTGFVASQGEAGCRTFAVDQASGSHVLELDQYDQLHPRTVGQLRAAIAEGGADVIYPDFVDLAVDGVLTPSRTAELGWETFEVGAEDGSGATWTVNRAFDPEPSALHQADYAPEIGLAWRRETFLALDGPDPALGNAGTFDMVCRAYLAGYEVVHLAGCVVLSRRHAYRNRDGAAEANTAGNHAHAMVVEWGRRNGRRSLDLGAARNPAPGFTGVDLSGAEINCDLRFGLPVEDGSIACVRAVDFLEHMNHCPDSTCRHGEDGGPRCVVGIMNELYRVLAPGGWLISRTPSTDGRGAFQDPTHCSFWNINSFWYYTRQEQAQYLSGVHCRFQAARLTQTFPSPWHEQHRLLYVDADLVALKGQRQPGLCLI